MWGGGVLFCGGWVDEDEGEGAVATEEECEQRQRERRQGQAAMQSLPEESERLCPALQTYKFSKVKSLVTLCSKCTWALTFENLYASTVRKVAHGPTNSTSKGQKYKISTPPRTMHRTFGGGKRAQSGHTQLRAHAAKKVCMYIHTYMHTYVHTYTRTYMRFSAISAVPACVSVLAALV